MRAAVVLLLALAASVHGKQTRLRNVHFLLTARVWTAENVYLTIAYCPDFFTGMGAVVKVDPVTGSWAIVGKEALGFVLYTLSLKANSSSLMIFLAAQLSMTQRCTS